MRFKTIECALCMTNTLVLCCYNGLVMVSGGDTLETDKLLIKMGKHYSTLMIFLDD